MTHVSKLMTANAPVPTGMTLIGYIDKHPINGRPLAVLLVEATGIEVGWDGAATVSLPRDWRDRTAFEAVDPAARA